MEIKLPRLLLSICIAMVLPSTLPASRSDGPNDDKRSVDNEPATRADVPHSRQKRILWITNDGRLALPPGTTMVINPSLSMPFVRNPPEGFFSNITISLPFTIDFDKLGLTDNENPYGTLPPIFSRSLGRAAGSVMVDYIGQYLDNRRGKRDTTDRPKTQFTDDIIKAIMERLHGGERALLYSGVEDMLSNFGLAGRACLLRAICEVHAHPLYNYGFLGEMLKLFFTASKSPFAKLLPEYVDAERAGSENGECWPYFKECPKSLFLPSLNKYSKEAEDHHRKQSAGFDNEIEDVFDTKFSQAM